MHRFCNIGGWYVAWFGYKPIIVITNPVHMKEILSNKFSQFRKMKLPPPASDLGGDSVASLEGEEWVQHRRIVSPAFFVEKLKVVTNASVILLMCSLITY
jgi:cytochrome P450